ncbi:MAG: hypothetical protein HYY04_06070 [Chloroflexi bacterium]|nr:hypothetical protein [Chloroflexota bacterium]
MLLADVKCYHCGHVSGEVVLENDEPPRPDVLRPVNALAKELPEGRPRCKRCGGPVYLDDIRRVRPPRLYDAMEKPRRGRPRRTAVLAQAC